MAPFTDYRLALILPQTRQLVAKQVGDAYVLPEIRIPLWERPAEQVTRLVDEQWNIRSIVLDFVLGPSPCAVVEVRTSTWDPSSAGLVGVNLDHISDEALRCGERTVLRSILAGEDYGKGPFSQIGWIEEAQTWIRDVTNDSGEILTGETLHLNAGGGFCLIRLAVSSGAGYWLKATGVPNTRESRITALLSENCPRYLPRIIATREDWNAWLMEEHGSSLSDSESLDDFLRAVHNMAELQKMFIGKSEALFSACCDDHRTATLDARIDDLISYLDEAMLLQVSTKAPILSSATLDNLAIALHRACSLQQELGIPDSLMHSDISPGSILYDGVRCVFTDWCEANVGNPFITLEQMCVHAARQGRDSKLWARALKDEYKARWLEILTESQIDRAFQLAPLLSVLSCLHGCAKWLDSPRRYEPGHLSCCRSLARHIDRVAKLPEMQEALCQ